MGVYNKTIITNAGINAIAQAIAESQTLAFKTACLHDPRFVYQVGGVTHLESILNS